MSDVTHILEAIQHGDAKASQELLPLVYDELRQLAERKMASESAGHTLQPTALVHEAWLRLVRTPDQSWQNRTHFFRTAAECMRRILIDAARRKQKRIKVRLVFISSGLNVEHKLIFQRKLIYHRPLSARRGCSVRSLPSVPWPLFSRHHDSAPEIPARRHLMGRECCHRDGTVVIEHQ